MNCGMLKLENNVENVNLYYTKITHLQKHIQHYLM